MGKINVICVFQMHQSYHIEMKVVFYYIFNLRSPFIPQDGIRVIICSNALLWRKTFGHYMKIGKIRQYLNYSGNCPNNCTKKGGDFSRNFSLILMMLVTKTYLVSNDNVYPFNIFWNKQGFGLLAPHCCFYFKNSKLRKEVKT